MRKAWRWITCHIFDMGHDNVLAGRLGWYPLFPIQCDDCHALFYRDPLTDGGRDNG